MIKQEDLLELIKLIEKSLQVQRIFSKIYSKRISIYSKTNFNIINNKDLLNLNKKEENVLKILKNNKEQILLLCEKLNLFKRGDLDFNLFEEYFNKIFFIQKKIIKFEKDAILNNKPFNFQNLIAEILSFLLNLQKKIYKNKILDTKKYKELDLNELEIKNENYLIQIKDMMEKTIFDWDLKYWFDRNEKHNPFGNINERANYCFAKSDMLLASSLWASGFFFPILERLDQYLHLKEYTFLVYNVGTFTYGTISVMLAVITGGGLYTIKALSKSYEIIKK